MIHLLQDTARERVVLDGKEIVFWESPSDRPHSWHEELWAMVEGRVMESLLRGGKGGNEATAPGAQGGWAWSSEDGVVRENDTLGGRGEYGSIVFFLWKRYCHACWSMLTSATEKMENVRRKWDILMLLSMTING